MNLADVMDELATRLRTIPRLKVHSQSGADLVPPAATVYYPTEYVYDETYGRGMDRMTLHIGIIVGAVVDRSARNTLAEYVNGSGSRSFKQVLESGEYATFDSVRVVAVDFGQEKVQNVAYIGAMFELDVAGQGAS